MMSVTEPQRDSGYPSGKMSLAQLMMNTRIMNLCADLVAKLQYIMFDQTRRGVFKTKMVRDMFNLAMLDLDDQFDVEKWYTGIVKEYIGDKRFDISPSKLTQTIEINWMLPLLSKEKETPGFIILLYNSLDMEDNCHTALAEKSKKEDEYDFQGLGVRNKTTQMLLGHQEVHRARITSGKK